MKVIIAGSREGFELKDVFEAVENSGFKDKITEVVSGTARGVDRLGEEWAKGNGVPIKRFPADWVKNGRAAGHIRNREMGDYADSLIVLIYNNSKGSLGMLEYAKKKGLKVFAVDKTINGEYDYFVLEGK